MCNVEYLELVRLHLDGRPVHRKVVVCEGIPQKLAEQICEETARALKSKVFVVKNNVRVFMLDFTPLSINGG